MKTEIQPFYFNIYGGIDHWLMNIAYLIFLLDHPFFRNQYSENVQQRCSTMRERVNP